MRPLRILSHALVGATMATALVWVVRDLGGFSHSSPHRVFNWHPLLMVFAFAVVQTEALLLFRQQQPVVTPTERVRRTREPSFGGGPLAFSGSETGAPSPVATTAVIATYRRPSHLKAAHGILHTVALAAALTGFAFVFAHILSEGEKHFTTSHSWTGVVVLVALLVHYAVAIALFARPPADSAAAARRLQQMPWHRFCGVSIYLLGLVTTLSGIMFKERASLDKKHPLDAMHITANVLAVLITLLGFVTIVQVVGPAAGGCAHNAVGIHDSDVAEVRALEFFDEDEERRALWRRAPSGVME